MNESFIKKSLYTFDKIIFYPGAISYIKRLLSEFDYELLLISNQVNLGTERLPRVIFYEFINKAFECEGIHLSSIAFYKESRKTGRGMLPSYFSKSYDRSQSFVTCENIIISPTVTECNAFWERKYNCLKFRVSELSYRRRSKETDIQISILIDGTGMSDIQSGFGFLNHLLDQICIHSNLDIGIKVKGDLHIDEHHSIEDTAIALGIALSKSLKDKRGIGRFGYLLPMDDNLVQVAIDLGGRSNLIWKASFEREKIGAVPTEMFYHFFKSFSDGALCNLNFQTEGNNEHHKIEAIFKAFAYVLKMATNRNCNNVLLPSTKKVL